MNIEKYEDLWETIDTISISDVATNLEMIQKAHGDGNYTMKEIITHQRAYQNWLFRMSRGDTKAIMECHRSVGCEFEFATYKSAETFPSHTLISISEPFSRLFQVAFALETDVYNELEIGIPPLLICNDSQKIQKQNIAKIWRLLKTTMSQINQEAQGKDIENLILLFQRYGLGSRWTQKLTFENIQIINRKKHRKKKEQVYSQLNISLNAEETTSFIKNLGISSYQSERHEYFQETYFKLYELLSPQMRAQEQVVAIVHLCKGVSHLLSIPSLLLLKEQPESNQNERGVYSSVKEVFGVWVKDSITNLVDNALKELASRTFFRILLDKNKGEMDSIMHTQIEKATKIIARLTNHSEMYAYDAYKEYEITIKQIQSRLISTAPKQIKTSFKTIYRQESFPSDGVGVRKDTFTTIYSSKSEVFHLTEFRNDFVIDIFLSRF